MMRRAWAAVRGIVDLIALGIIDAHLARREYVGPREHSKHAAVDDYLRELERDPDEGDR